MADMVMPTVPRVIVMGVSGCGKTSIAAALAERLALPMIEGDALHAAESIAKMSAGIALTDADRWPWLDRVATRLVGLPAGGVATCSALRRSYRDRLRGIVGPSLRFVMLDLPRAALLDRMSTRSGHFMPSALLDSQLTTLEHPAGEVDAIVIDASVSAQDIARIVADQLVGLTTSN